MGYQVTIVDEANSISLDDELNRMGALGWILVQVIPHKSNPWEFTCIWSKD